MCVLVSKDAHTNIFSQCFSSRPDAELRQQQLISVIIIITANHILISPFGLVNVTNSFDCTK